jgi:MEMO1 family protein
LIVPHAGYIYSGRNRRFRLHPAETECEKQSAMSSCWGRCIESGFRGWHLPDATAFETPLGQVRSIGPESPPLPVCRKITRLASSACRRAFAGSASALPAMACSTISRCFRWLAGGARRRRWRKYCERLWGGDETLIVVSSDLSHFLSYAVAQRRDDQPPSNAMLGWRPI